MKEFVYEDIEKGYENCEFKRVPGKSPVLLFYDHQKLLYESIIDFLATECGTMSGGGLQASAEGD